MVLNCLGHFGSQILKQAADLGMTASGWAWLVTDGITIKVNGEIDAFGCWLELIQ